MAQNQFVNVTLDPSAAKKTDSADHKNASNQAGAASANVTVSWDNAVITTMTQLRSCVNSALQIAAGQLSK